MHYDIITIFPKIFDSFLNESLLKRAQKKKLIKIKIHNLRDYTTDQHKTVDDKPYGGGPGMIFKIEPIYKALQKIKKSKSYNQKATIILLTPAGKQFDQKMAKKFSKLEQLIFICGRYEGVDARVEKLAQEKISIGPYILNGGELAALNIIEATSRLIPQVVGKQESLAEETFSQNNGEQIIKEYPQYTRPDNFRGYQVPKVLLSGDHQKIKAWRQKQLKTNPKKH